MKTIHLTTLALSIAALGSPAFAQSSTTSNSSGETTVEATDNSAPAVMKKTQDRIEKIDKIKKDAEAASDGVTPATAQKMAIEAAAAESAPPAIEEPQPAQTTPSSAAVKAMNPSLTVEDSPALKAISEATERNKSIDKTQKAANRATAAANADAAVEAAASEKKTTVIETTTTTTTPVPATGALIKTQ